MHGYAGALIIVAAEVLLFSGNQLVGHWFTPIIWTGYILFVDALVYKIQGRSLLVNDRFEFFAVAIISIASWWLFEFYNAPRFWNSNLELWWHYHNLEPNLWVRRLGYDWAFATITPAMLETAELFGVTIFRGKTNGARIKLSKSMRCFAVVVGVVGVAVPIIYPNEWFAPVVWLSFIFLLDPLNALRGWPSIAGDLLAAIGDGYFRCLQPAYSADFSGNSGIIGRYRNGPTQSPYFGNIKIFEMPVFGFLGFPPFAIECWAMYIFVRSLLSSRPQQTANAKIFLSSNA
jgi:hypothetical protein